MAGPPDAVQVYKNASVFHVRISKSTSLEQILARICSEADARCEGLSLTSELPASPSDISGSWSEIVTRLMEGTELNYVAQSPNSGTITSLLIEKKPAGEEPRDNSHPLSQAAGPTLVGTYNGVSAQSNTSNLAGQTSANLPENSSQQIPIALVGSSGDPSTLTLPPTEAVSGSPSTGSIPVANGEPAAFLPFPDNGRLIPTKNSQPDFLPFPDNGRLIPTKNVQPDFLPFPDNGRLIPVNPNAPTGSPFPETNRGTGSGPD